MYLFIYGAPDNIGFSQIKPGKHMIAVKIEGSYPYV